MLQRKIALAKTLLRIGPRRLLLVAQHRRKLKKGAYLQQTPPRSWSEFTPSRLRTPLVAPSRSQLQSVLGEQGLASLISDADRIVGGELRYFSWEWRPRSAWRANPDNGFETPLVHWSQIKDFDASQGDIKRIWEPSRFDWAVTLARAFAATGDSKYERTFLELLKDWREHNPPNQGINWYCGQECSLRLMALLIAAAVFTSTEARELISTTVAALAERVEPTMGYAIGQHNNHGTSEATGIFLAGCVLPDHSAAARWRAEGRRILEQLILEQFKSDGSYVQHSFIYQRVALRACLLAALTSRKFEDKPLDGRAEDSLAFGIEFLRELMVGPAEGRLPNYGANDGANPLALSQCDYLDFRPILQLGTVLLDEQRAYESGPWDEELLWLGLDGNKPMAEAPEPSFFALDGGYARITEQGWSAFMRAPKYTDGRPGQADALHCDVWLDGKQVAIDSGTYSYNDTEGWYKHFKSTAAHNTVEVEGKDQMPLASRFLYTHWTESELLIGENADEDGMSAVGSSDFVRGHGVGGVSQAYRQIGFGVTHRRVVGVAADGITVADTLEGAIGQRAKLVWHLDGDWELQGEVWVRPADGIQFNISSESQLDIHVRVNEPPYTSVSEAYGQTRAITLVEAHFVTGVNTCITTHFIRTQD